jgi:proline racemase
MNWDRSLDLLLVHCQGEIGKVIVGGAPEIPGATMLDKMNHINTVDDSLRRFVTFEPRASVAMSVNLLVAPTRPDADAGFIVLQADRAHPMSGSNCICVVTALLESGQVAMREPETFVRLDTPAGLIVARWGRIKVDIAFGGVYYAIIDVDQIGVDIAPAHARYLAEAGIELKSLLAEQVTVKHPELPGVDEIAYVMFRGQEPDGAVRTCTTLKPGRVDRSPCGTGSSANLATLYVRGEIAIGDRRTSRSIIGGEFVAEAIGATEVGGRPAVLPRITGRGWIYGREQLRLSDDDPFRTGFALSDSWGPQVHLLTAEA